MEPNHVEAPDKLYFYVTAPLPRALFREGAFLGHAAAVAHRVLPGGQQEARPRRIHTGPLGLWDGL